MAHNSPLTSVPEQSELGKASRYVDHYDASLLFPLPRADKRAELGLGEAMPFFGADIWTAYELSWLNARGKPQLALAHCRTAARSGELPGKGKRPSLTLF